MVNAKVVKGIFLTDVVPKGGGIAAGTSGYDSIIIITVITNIIVKVCVLNNERSISTNVQFINFKSNR